MLLLFLTFLLAHFAADFVFQGHRLIQLKKKHLHQGLALHSLCHLVITMLAVSLYTVIVGDPVDITWGTMAVAAFFVAILHYLIDWMKVASGKRFTNTIISAGLFLIDQLLHVISIIVVLHTMGLIRYSFAAFKADSLQFLFGHMIFSDPVKLMLLVIIFILVTQGAGYFLNILLRNLGPTPSLGKGTYSIADEQTQIKTYHNEQGEEAQEVITVKTERIYRDSPHHIGRYIGMIERVLIIIFIVQGIPHGMMFLIAVKSLARFKQFESKEFAEYYLVGSLSSALIALVFGYAVLRII
ncbi:DUF3307 domain-containing protein [Desmospora activa]|uniref:Uncharacterized protein DUF3307 n=1 Tax=Desmospora activa DSM 45169 TaxID=1121389 RepID=A0A2T4ZBY0_9BACL|nr:DUF3307 domain-containing protein [Desmospora activa]PTM59385.1 uncharacterized protein DUF3307 [Desmospora activa DSM 45169]